jgi:hypothetical protein
VEAARKTTPATPTAARSALAFVLSRAPSVARLFGVLVLGYGILLSGTTSLWWLGLQPPGSTLGPPSLVQGFMLRITEGVYLAIFGVVLAAGGTVLQRRERGLTAEGGFPISERWKSLFAYSAVALIVLAAVVGALPSPHRTLMFGSSDFQIRTLPGNQPYENYFMSRPFFAFEGEALFPGFSVTWTDNQTGAVVERDALVTAWVTAPSEFPHPMQFGDGNLAPADGSYVAWVRDILCETPATPPCSNYTASATGNLTIVTQKAYVPVQLILGAAGSVLMAVVLVQSGRGNRRMTSR